MRGMLRGVIPRALGGGSGGTGVGAGAVSGSASASGAGATGEEGVAEVVARSLVLLQVDIAPVALADGVHARTFKGAGVVVAHGGEKARIDKPTPLPTDVEKTVSGHA